MPPGHTSAPRGVPKNRKVGCEQEEKRLRELGEPAGAYLDKVMSKETPIPQKPAFIRRLYTLSRQLGRSVFLSALDRALAYEVWDLAAIERIAHLAIHADTAGASPALGIPEYYQDYQQRPSYREGQFTNENDVTYGESC